MRRLRWLLPVAIVAIVGTVWSIYVERRESLANAAPSRPEPLEDGVHGRAFDWCYTQSQGDIPRVEVCAVKLNEVEGVKQLEGARIKLFHANATAYDLVESDLVRFHEQEKKLYSEGDVEITLAVPVEAGAGARLLSIHSSGVEFDADTGKAFTERDVSFEFEYGSGSAVGAFYDPASRELRLNKNVVLDWRGKDPDASPMRIESGEAWYFERESKVLFHPWSKLTRAGLTLDAGASEVILEEGVIRRADIRNGRGTQKNPNRDVEFGAEQMYLNFNARMAIETINAERKATLVSAADASRTTVASNRLDLTFRANGSESALNTAVATGNSSVEAAPVPRRGVEPADTRLLRSEVIRLFMRPEGEEIERVVTDGKGTLDFLPSRPAQPKRSLEGDRIWIDYGARNRIRQFRSENASTRTERAEAPPMTTAAKEILGRFDAGTGELVRLEHTGDFAYTEGANRANATSAVLEQKTGDITLTGAAKANDAKGSVAADTIIVYRLTGVLALTGAARAEDASGSVVADRIVQNRNTGDFEAEGNVTTTRRPDDKGPSLLSNREVMQATARRMTTSGGNQQLHYEGDAKLWQGANRIEAARIDIDRAARVLEAHGSVVTQLMDRAPENDGPPANASTRRAPAVFTVVHARDLVYTEASREVHYSNGVELERPNLTVTGADLRAYLTESSGDTSLDHAFATGSAKIVSTAVESGKQRVRTGTADRAEYYAAEQKVVLRGGQPTLVDNVKGNTTGQELIWWANSDRLDVNGSGNQPARSVIRKQ